MNRNFWEGDKASFDVVEVFIVDDTEEVVCGHSKLKCTSRTFGDGSLLGQAAEA